MINEHIPYSHLSCPDWMVEAGKAYDELQGGFISLYKKAPQTDKEAVLSAIQG